MSVDTGDNPKIDVSTLKTYPNWIYGAKNYDGKTVPDGLYTYDRNNNKTEPKTLDEAIQNDCVAFAVNGRSVYDFYFKDEDNKLNETKKRMENKVVVFCSQLGGLATVQIEKDEIYFYPDTENLNQDRLLNPNLSKTQLAKDDIHTLESNKKEVDKIINAEIASASQSDNQKKSLFSLPSFFGQKSGGKRKTKKSKTPKTKKSKTKKSKTTKSKKSKSTKTKK